MKALQQIYLFKTAKSAWAAKQVNIQWEVILKVNHENMKKHGPGFWKPSKLFPIRQAGSSLKVMGAIREDDPEIAAVILSSSSDSNSICKKSQVMKPTPWLLPIAASPYSLVLDFVNECKNITQRLNQRRSSSSDYVCVACGCTVPVPSSSAASTEKYKKTDKIISLK